MSSTHQNNNEFLFEKWYKNSNSRGTILRFIVKDEDDYPLHIITDQNKHKIEKINFNIVEIINLLKSLNINRYYINHYLSKYKISSLNSIKNSNLQKTALMALKIDIKLRSILIHSTEFYKSLNLGEANLDKLSSDTILNYVLYINNNIILLKRVYSEIRRLEQISIDNFVSNLYEIINTDDIKNIDLFHNVFLYLKELRVIIDTEIIPNIIDLQNK